MFKSLGFGGGTAAAAAAPSAAPPPTNAAGGGQISPNNNSGSTEVFIKLALEQLVNAKEAKKLNTLKDAAKVATGRRWRVAREGGREVQCGSVLVEAVFIWDSLDARPLSFALQFHTSI